MTYPAQADHELLDLFGSVSDIGLPMTVADPDGNDCPLIFANEAFENLTGFGADRLVGRNCRLLQGDDTAAYEIAKIRKAISRRLSSVTALKNYSADGAGFHNLLIIRPIYLKSGKCLFVGCQFRFDLATQIDTIRRGSMERHEMIDRLSATKAKIAVTQRDALTMRAEAAVMRVTNYLRTMPPD